MMRFAWAVPLVAWFAVAWPAGGDDKPLVVVLWPGKVPDETGALGAETVRTSPKLDRSQVEVTEPTRMVTNVSKPSRTVYRPAKDKDIGTAVLTVGWRSTWVAIYRAVVVLRSSPKRA